MSFLIITIFGVFLVGAGVLFLNPGTFHINWLGYTLESSISVAFLCIVILILGIGLLTACFYKVRFYFKSYHYKRQIKTLNQQSDTFLKGIVLSYLKDSEELEKVMLNNKLPFPYKTFLESQKEILLNQQNKAALTLSKLLDHPSTAPYALTELTNIISNQGRYEELPHLISKILENKNLPALSVKGFYELVLKHQFFNDSQKLFNQIKPKLSKDDRHYLEALYYVEKAKNTSSKEEKKEFFQKAFNLYAHSPVIIEPYFDYLLSIDESKKVIKYLKSLWDQVQNTEIRKIALKALSDYPMIKQIEEAEKIIIKTPHTYESLMLIGELSLKHRLWGGAQDVLDKLMERFPVKDVLILKQTFENLRSQHTHDYQKALVEPVSSNLLPYV